MFVREVAPCTADSVAQRLAGRPGLAWLDGECSGARDARYSVVTSDPTQAVRADARHASPLSVLDELSQAHGADSTPEHPLLPRSAVPRWIGFIAYDAALGSHQRLRARDAHAQVGFFRYAACLVFDHQTGRVFVAGDDEAACYALLERTRAELQPLSAQVGDVEAADPNLHAAAIEQALEHIRRGDIYQVNLARAFTASYAGHPLLLALAMRQASPVPLGFYLDDGARTVVARTMELFLRFSPHDRQLVTRPIKGTLARHGDDQAEAATLAADPKERAEHAMIIDLMRNDLGRVAEVGSVRVPEIMAVERYAKLSHLVSTVTCTLRSGLGLGAIAQATFPPGSVTGTPKLRAMELIEALEPLSRGVYTGAVGAVDRAGGFTLAVAIRTATVAGGQARYFAGGGIVEASHIEREIAETELKARVFRDALTALR